MDGKNNVRPVTRLCREFYEAPDEPASIIGIMSGSG